MVGYRPQSVGMKEKMCHVLVEIGVSESLTAPFAGVSGYAYDVVYAFDVCVCVFVCPYVCRCALHVCFKVCLLLYLNVFVFVCKSISHCIFPIHLLLKPLFHRVFSLVSSTYFICMHSHIL